MSSGTLASSFEIYINEYEIQFTAKQTVSVHLTDYFEVWKQTMPQVAVLINKYPAPVVVQDLDKVVPFDNRFVPSDVVATTKVAMHVTFPVLGRQVVEFNKLRAYTNHMTLHGMIKDTHMKVEFQMSNNSLVVYCNVREDEICNTNFPLMSQDILDSLQDVPKLARTPYCQLRISFVGLQMENNATEWNVVQSEATMEYVARYEHLWYKFERMTVKAHIDFAKMKAYHVVLENHTHLIGYYGCIYANFKLNNSYCELAVKNHFQLCNSGAYAVQLLDQEYKRTKVSDLLNFFNVSFLSGDDAIVHCEVSIDMFTGDITMTIYTTSYFANEPPLPHSVMLSNLNLNRNSKVQLLLRADGTHELSIVSLHQKLYHLRAFSDVTVHCQLTTF